MHAAPASIFGLGYLSNRLGLGRTGIGNFGNFGLNRGFNNFGLNRGFNNLGFNRFGSNNFGLRRPFFGGCFNCGFGFGFGFGSPWWGLGLGWADPFWFDPWYPAYDYGWGWPGYYGPSSIYYGGPYDQPYYDQSYDYNQPYADAPPDQPAPSDTPSDSSGGAEYPPQAAAPAPNLPPDRNDNAASATLLYLRDGSVLTVTDVWLTDSGMLHYTLANGSEASLDMDRIDLPRTVNENGKRGVPFILKSAPANPAPVPNANLLAAPVATAAA